MARAVPTAFPRNAGKRVESACGSAAFPMHPPIGYNHSMKIAFVIPVFNEEHSLEALAEGIIEHVGEHEHRLIFVDDGSTDGSYEVLRRLQARFDCVDVIKFRHNFGKTLALAAGFSRARGDIVITMDADLQDQPKEIPKFLAALEEGCDLVCGWKVHRKDPWHKTIPSRVYNRYIRKTFGLALHDINTGFKAMRMEVAKRIPLYGEMHRLIPVFAAQLGYRITEIPVEHQPRHYGKSKYGVERFLRGGLDAFTAAFLMRYHQSPSHFYGKVGLIGAGGSFVAFAAAPLAAAYLATAYHASSLLEVLAATDLVLLLIFMGLVLLTLSFLAFGMGLLGELIIRRLPMPDPSIYIEEEHIG